MAVFYYSMIDTGLVGLNMALGVPMVLVGIGLYADTLELFDESR